MFSPSVATSSSRSCTDSSKTHTPQGATFAFAAFGDPPEADQDFVTDSIEVAIEARSVELRDEPDRALWVRQLGTLDA
jgi:hypothetical protein